MVERAAPPWAYSERHLNLLASPIYQHKPDPVTETSMSRQILESGYATMFLPNIITPVRLIGFTTI